MATRKVILRLEDQTGNVASPAYQAHVTVNGVSTLQFTPQGDPFTVGLLDTLDFFPLLPAAAVAAGTDKYTTLLGTNTPVVAQSTTGGILLTTGATSGNQSAVGAVASTGLRAVISANSMIEFRGQVNLPAIVTLLAGFGLDQTPADVDPNAAAGDGASFLFDPGSTIAATGVAAQATNWMLCTKVNGVYAYQDSGVVVASGIEYDLRIAIDGSRKANFFINGVQVGVAGPAHTNAAVVGVVAGVKTKAAATAAINVRYVRLSRQIG